MKGLIRHTIPAPVCIVLAQLLFSAVCGAQEMALPASTQIPLFAKILSYDRHLDQRTNREIVVGILYQSRFHQSSAACDGVVSAIQYGPVRTITGIPVRGIPIDIDGVDDLQHAIASTGANVLYVTPLRSLDIGSIRAITRKMKIISITGVPDYVQEGIALGIDVRDDRPLIVINVRAAAEEGADLSSQVLRLARIIP